MMTSVVFYTFTAALTVVMVRTQIPSSCTVTQNKVDCRNRGLTQFPQLSNLNLSVTELDFSGNKIKSIAQFKVPKNNRILVLDLHNNLIGSVDDESFVDLTKLKHLDLSTNLIQKLTTSTFSGLTNILEIDIGYNKLESMSGGIFPRSVTSLTLDGNSFKEMPIDAFILLTNLYYLGLNNNSFISINAGPDTLNYTINARYVSLENMQNLERVSSAAFAHYPDMQILHVSNNPKLKEVTDNAFPSTILNLTSVVMSNNSLDSIPEHMMVWSNLQQLDFSGNPFVCDSRFCWMLKQRETFAAFSDKIR